MGSPSPPVRCAQNSQSESTGIPPPPPIRIQVGAPQRQRTVIKEEAKHQSSVIETILSRKRRSSPSKHESELGEPESKKLKLVETRSCNETHDTKYAIKLNATNSVQSWSHYAVIYWLNRANEGTLAYIEYVSLRKHIFFGKINGNDLALINKVILRMIGMHDETQQVHVLSAIQQLLANEKQFDNVAHNTLVTEDIPFEYCDPVTFEIMHDPVTLTVSGRNYERLVIAAYIKRFNKDPLTQKPAGMQHLLNNEELRDEINSWRTANTSDHE